MDIRQTLFSLQDPGYKAFQCKLMPTVSPDAVIGVRIPELRRLARSLRGSQESEAFLHSLPHGYYDENNLHGFLLEHIRDFDACILALDSFLPHVDNWATCDLMNPPVLARHLPELLPHIRRWMESDHPYTVRFGMELLMRHYLTDAFSPEYLQMAAEVESQEYYVNMMAAWFFATALAKQYDSAIVYLEQQRLPLWTHNKTIRKALESDRISPEKKLYLKTLKRSRK